MSSRLGLIARNGRFPFLFLLSVMLFAPFLSAQSEPIRLRDFLRGWVGTPTEETRTTRYSSAFVDLNGDGSREAIVYLSSDGWCGTGGCTMLILAPQKASYILITKTTVTHLPIRVLATKSNGWNDIGVIARTDGIEPLYEAVLSFDGKTYPSNPSVPPARQSKGKARGRIVISATAKDEPLYN
jgi:hypothetical protein